MIELVESCSCEKWEAGSWGRGQGGNLGEGGRQPLKAATKQRLVKTEKNLCVLYLTRTVIFKVYNSVGLS
jgi:hypothetical protein